MKLYEYQAKEIFRECGIPIPQGKLVTTVEEARKAGSEIGFPVVIKSQILRGGRGKAGLIRFASSEDEVAREAEDLIGREHQGAIVQKLLIEPKLDIEKELYVSILVDPVKAAPLIMASAEGGVEIEELAKDRPEKIVKEYVPVFKGIQGYIGRGVAKRLGFSGPMIRSFASVVYNLYGAFKKFDAELAEINPLVVVKDGSILAADAKMNIDDNSLYRQKRFEKTRDQYDNDIEYEAAKLGFPYVQIDENGDIGVMSAGAGLTMTTLDLINYYGGKPANFLEFGGPLYQRTVQAMKLALMNKNIKVLCITVFGQIARADVIAEGIVAAIKEHKPSIPIVVAVRGTGEERARELLKGAGLDPLDDTEEAIRRAVRIAEESK